MSRVYRIGLLGTPQFAVTIFDELRVSEKFEISCVITETDKPSGRGHKLQSTPVKLWATDFSIPVLQPSSLKRIQFDENTRSLSCNSSVKANQDFTEFLNSHKPFDIFITAAYGKIIPQAILDFPTNGILNVHASLLPRWRGAAPIHRALFSGDKSTGVCLMKTELTLDTGPVFLSKELDILDSDNYLTLHNRLASLGAKLLAENLEAIISGEILSTPQPESNITYAEKWDTAERAIDWSEAAETIQRRIRTCSPAPGARAVFGNLSVKILLAHTKRDQNYPKLAPGSIVDVNRAELVIACGGNSFLSIDEMQFPGKSRLPIAEIIKGRSFEVGDCFS